MNTNITTVKATKFFWAAKLFENFTISTKDNGLYVSEWTMFYIFHSPRIAAEILAKSCDRTRKNLYFHYEIHNSIEEHLKEAKSPKLIKFWGNHLVISQTGDDTVEIAIFA